MGDHLVRAGPGGQRSAARAVLVFAANTAPRGVGSAAGQARVWVCVLLDGDKSECGRRPGPPRHLACVHARPRLASAAARASTRATALTDGAPRPPRRSHEDPNLRRKLVQEPTGDGFDRKQPAQKPRMYRSAAQQAAIMQL